MRHSVSLDFGKHPTLDRLYQDYLATEKTASFVRDVASHYTVATLCRLSTHGQRISRRAAVLALGFLADYDANPYLGRALHDGDRAVRLLADNSIRAVWLRCGSAEQQLELRRLIRLNNNGQFDRVIRDASDLIETAPWIAESWNQRGIAWFQVGDYEASANDCHQALEINPYQFTAAIGLAHCYLEMHEPNHALQSLRRALRLNPDLDGVRAQVEYLERSL